MAKTPSEIARDVFSAALNAIRVTGSVAVAAKANPTVAAGETTASIAAALIADTGQLAAGTYMVEVVLGFSGTGAAGKHLAVQHRDAANTGTVSPLGLCPAGGAIGLAFERVVIAANQRIRVVVGAVAAAAAEVTQAQIRVYLL